MLDFLFRRFRKKRQEQVSRGLGGQRYLALEDGDSCLILKKNGKSIIVDSGGEQLSRADEILCMVWCYLANPEFVKILDSLFSEIVDEVNRDKLSGDKAVGWSGVYAGAEEKEKGEGSGAAG